MSNVVQHSKETVEWYTPSHIVESARRVMGHIDLDPASNHVANETVKAKTYLSSEWDGLKQDWYGKVFLNPPGGDAPKGSPTRSNSVLWWSKLAYEYASEHVVEAFFIGFSIEVLQAAQLLNCDQPLKYPFCVPRERMKFIDHRTLAPARMPAHANVIVYLPNRDDNLSKQRFAAEFFKYGIVLNA